MVTLAGYEDFRKIHESDNSQVYRALRMGDRQPVIIKFLNRDYPTSEEIRRYKQEYHLTSQLDSPGIVKAYELVEWERSYAIVLEDFGGISLKEWLQEREKLSLSEILLMAIAITESLGQIHAQNIIHKDINTANIVLNPESKELKIIDFGISTQLSRENPTLKNPKVLEGTLAYISPEQTGRMNRSLDYRTDFYSLGVTLYEMLTKKLPYETEDALELVHCHLAKQPRSPGEIEPSIPPIISEIVMKLMAKNAEERYQSAWGLKADLEKCRQQLESVGKIEFFPLASQDISDRFSIPQKLYGREAEIATLLAAFERVAETGKVELMMVAGYSGIGKSSLVQELYKPITARRGYFISGKFDQFQRNIPYSALVSAFGGLIRQLLGETEAGLQGWREKLFLALGNNGQVIIDVIPEVELIIGKQPAVPILGANEAQNRFNLAIGNFIRTFCDRSHPLTLFLDDLQWADLATLQLMERMLVDGQTEYLLLLGAYRDNEVSASHPLMMTLKKIQQNNATINQIKLKPLSLDQIPGLIGDTLQRADSCVRSLSQLVWQKTGGNPFFVKEFLQALERENLLQFYRKSRSWQWDMAAIAARDFTDNVVELMVEKLQQLPVSSQEILSLAACLGAEFDLTLLTGIAEKSAPDIFASLKIALDMGLIYPLSELDENLLIQSYKFNHDRIQQAAYSAIGDREKQEISLQIGRLLLEKLDSQEQRERIFEIVDRLNAGRMLIADELERLELVKLNLAAGKRAKNATAYLAAREYLIVGIEELKNVTKDPWLSQYELTFALSKELALIEYLNGNLDAAEEVLQYAMTRVTSTLERGEIYNMLIVQYTMTAKYSEGIDSGRKALKLFGINLPTTDLEKALSVEFELFKQNLGDREIASLLHEPAIQIPEQIIVGQILVNLDLLTYFCDQKLFGVVVAKMANYWLTYGNIPESSKGYVSYGVLLTCVVGDYQSAYEFGCLAVKLSDRFNSKSQKCSACLVVGGHLNHWVKHIKYAKELFDDAYHLGLSVGELRFSGYALEHNSRYLFYQGVNLQEILELIPKYLQFLQQTKNQWAADGVLGFQLILLNLLGMTASPLDFHNNNINEFKYLEDCRAHNSFAWLCTFNIFKAQVLYLYDKLDAALDLALEAGKYLNFVLSQFQYSEYNFHYSLIITALYLDATESSQQKYWQQLEANQKQMKIWMDCCPANFQHKYLLISAEIARISGKNLEAMELYDRAIASARENEFVQNEALANELAAKFWLKKGKEEFAQLYMRKAHYGYQLWGALRKVEDLQEKYSQLLAKTGTNSQAIGNSTSTIATTTTTGTEQIGNLDINAVMKASQALSGEIVLDKLLATLMKIALENAGAQKGYLLLQTEEAQWTIEAEGRIDTQEVATHQSRSIDNTETPLVSTAIVNYVARTLESVVLADAVKEGQFTRDPYIVATKPKSILCTPLVKQGKLSGILYLENNLAVGAFTKERTEILQVLSSQAAIAIDNARLYNSLEEKVELRTVQLAEATRKAEAANEAKSAFIANMSHELRTPLNAILGFSQLLTRSQTLDREQQENVSIISRSGEHLLTLINQVLDLSKIEAGRITLNPKNFDLYRLLDEIEDLLGLKASEKGLQLLCDRDPDTPRYINTDEMKLRQVLINLINNGIKFTSEGGVVVRVRPIADNSPNIKLEFEIEDTGAGIAPEDMKSLFEAFVQTATGKEAQEGTGLGLPISRKFVQLMGGDIVVTSSVGRGTTFKFNIQATQSDSASVERKLPMRRAIALAPNQPRYRLLVVDDKPTNRQLLIKLLVPFGFELKEAANGREAVEIYQQWQADLVFMDMRMPVMDGYEATGQIKSLAGDKSCFVVAVTASVLEEEKAVVLEAGCDDFLRKPFKDGEILEAISRHLGAEFIYEEAARMADSDSESEALTAEDLAAVPSELLTAMEDGMMSVLDLDDIQEIIDAIASHDPAVGRKLETFVRDFRHEEILNLIEKSKYVNG